MTMSGYWLVLLFGHVCMRSSAHETPHQSRSQLSPRQNSIAELHPSDSSPIKSIVGKLRDVHLDTFTAFRDYEVHLQDYPSWLTYDEKHHVLLGVPTEADVGLSVITAVTSDSASDGGKRLDVEVVVAEIHVEHSPPHVALGNSLCSHTPAMRSEAERKHRYFGLDGITVPEDVALERNGATSGSPTTFQHSTVTGGDSHTVLASLILCSSPGKVYPTTRVLVLKLAAEFLSVPTNCLTWMNSEGDGLQFARPGYRIIAGSAASDGSCEEDTNSELFWPLTSSASRHMADFTRVLQHNVNAGRVQEEVGIEVIGWYVATDEVILAHKRLRRRSASRTPVLTPSVYLSPSTTMTTNPIAGDLTSVSADSSLKLANVVAEPSRSPSAKTDLVAWSTDFTTPGISSTMWPSVADGLGVGHESEPASLFPTATLLHVSSNTLEPEFVSSTPHLSSSTLESTKEPRFTSHPPEWEIEPSEQVAAHVSLSEAPANAYFSLRVARFTPSRTRSSHMFDENKTLMLDVGRAIEQPATFVLTSSPIHPSEPIQVISTHFGQITVITDAAATESGFSYIESFSVFAPESTVSFPADTLYASIHPSQSAVTSRALEKHFLPMFSYAAEFWSLDRDWASAESSVLLPPRATYDDHLENQSELKTSVDDLEIHSSKQPAISIRRTSDILEPCSSRMQSEAGNIASVLPTAMTPHLVSSITEEYQTFEEDSGFQGKSSSTVGESAVHSLVLSVRETRLFKQPVDLQTEVSSYQKFTSVTHGTGHLFTSMSLSAEKVALEPSTRSTFPCSMVMSEKQPVILLTVEDSRGTSITDGTPFASLDWGVDVQIISTVHSIDPIVDMAWAETSSLSTLDSKIWTTGRSPVDTTPTSEQTAASSAPIRTNSSSHVPTTNLITTASAQQHDAATLGRRLSSDEPSTSLLHITPEQLFVPTSTEPPENHPMLMNPLSHISAMLGSYFEWEIPRDMFYDMEDGDTRALTLTLTLPNDRTLSNNFWLQLDPGRQVLYGLPLVADLDMGYHSVVVVATDSHGLGARNLIGVYVNSSAFVNFTHRFIMKFEVDFGWFMRQRENAVNLLQKISSFMGDNSSRHITVEDLRPGSLILSWTNSSLSGVQCQNATIYTIFQRMVRHGGTIRSAFIRHMGRKLRLSEIVYQPDGVCLYRQTEVMPSTTMAVVDNETDMLTSIIAPVLIGVLLLLLLFIVVLYVILSWCCQQHTTLQSLNKDILTTDRSPVVFPSELQSCGNGADIKAKPPALLPCEREKEERLHKIGQPSSEDHEDALTEPRALTVNFTQCDRQSQLPTYWPDESQTAVRRPLPYLNTTQV